MIDVEACVFKLDPSSSCKREKRITSIQLFPGLHAYVSLPNKLIIINKYFLIMKNYNLMAITALRIKATM